ncbi:cuticle collagen 1-like [Pantherophis guttatus]|uniref:Cuticle collagen 1-like n=1 Tax=Pantherophis guttatus TaxID=94885 RepID=A0ABM3ZPH7_PANGU|nr:cuticle collagen 1-like [Pantherophis guttatus]
MADPQPRRPRLLKGRQRGRARRPGRVLAPATPGWASPAPPPKQPGRPERFCPARAGLLKQSKEGAASPPSSSSARSAGQPGFPGLRSRPRPFRAAAKARRGSRTPGAVRPPGQSGLRRGKDSARHPAAPAELLGRTGAAAGAGGGSGESRPPLPLLPLLPLLLLLRLRSGRGEVARRPDWPLPAPGPAPPVK